MFAVDDATAEAIRRACDEGGELAGVVELRRHFPLLANNENARMCVRAIAAWKPITLSSETLRQDPAIADEASYGSDRLAVAWR